MRLSAKTQAHSSGLTLLELLVVIVVIAILVAITIPAAGKYRSYTDNLKCVTNLREMGRAVLSYTADNNSTYPGPLTGNQRPYTAPYFITPNPPSSTSLTRQVALVDRIAPYINIYVEPGKAYTPITIAEIMVCPAGRTQVESTGKSYEQGLYYNTASQPSGEPRPFGYWGSATGYTLPRMVTEIENPSQMIGIVCTDNTHRPSPHVPATPPHGNKRNVLFLDGHVRSISLEDFDSLYD